MSKLEAKDMSCVLDAKQINRSITRIAHEILERNKGAGKLAVVGIRTRGEFIAKRLQDKIKEIEGKEIPFGVVDITFYRDDLGQISEQPQLKGTSLPFHVDDYNIVLVDDVFYTGRTVRAAIDAIIDFGRPITVQLAVVCDRGHRELPFKADYVGKNLPTEPTEFVRVFLNEVDGVEGVYIKRDE